jgi:hypothetical protein
LPNLSVPYHIASASGYGVPETRWKSELRSVLAGSRNGEELWNTITASPLRMSYRPAQERNLPFIRPGPALPYAARLGFAIFEKDGHSVLDAGFDPFKEVVIAGEDKVSDFTDPKRAEDIPILERTPEKITVDAKKGWIYLAESYDPGWKAYLNGTRCTISRANGAFMAVLANGSQNKVVFDYSVPGFKAGCGLTILFAGFLTILVLRKGNEYQDKG